MPTDDEDPENICHVCSHRWFGVIALCPMRSQHEKILAEREKILEKGRKLAESGRDAPTPTEEDKK